MRRELPSKVNGSARYSIDVELPGMLYAEVLHAPIVGSEPASIKDADAKAVAGVKAVMKIATGVAVVAETPWAAFNGKDALSVSWSKTGKAQGFDSDEAIERYAAIARGDIAHPTDKLDVVGDVAAGLRTAKETVTAEYRCDYAYHAQMEPQNAVASVAPAGEAIEVWCGTQSPTMAVTAAAKAAGVTAKNVKIHCTLLGGSFGRRGERDQDWILDAVLLSKQLKRPVKVMWRREEDLHDGRFRPMSAHHVEAGFDSSGAVTAWHVRLVTDNVGLFQDPVRYYGPWHEKDMISFQGADLPTYSIPNRLAEHAKIDTGIRLSSLRGIGFTANKFVAEAFVDELARNRGADPVAFRLALLKDAPRARKVVQTVADMADWYRKRQDSALGIAYMDYSGSQIAGIAEISLDRTSGQISVHNFWVAIDAGRAVQPDNIVAQVESCVVYGLGLALTERVSFKDGVPQQSNFYDYIVPRMKDIPQIHTKVISTDNHPTGVGQMATPLVTPAVCNAVAELTGARLRHAPMLPERAKAALKA
jgi:isoquinoline 1-oxidoreductase beta subunit